MCGDHYLTPALDAAVAVAAAAAAAAVATLFNRTQSKLSGAPGAPPLGVCAP